MSVSVTVTSLVTMSVEVKPLSVHGTIGMLVELYPISDSVRVGRKWVTVVLGNVLFHFKVLPPYVGVVARVMSVAVILGVRAPSVSVTTETSVENDTRS